MKIAIIMGLCLVLICGSTLTVGGAKSPQNDDAFESFWKSFKKAVIHGDRGTIGTLSRFPIGMSYPASNINSGFELRRRYRESAATV